MKVEVVYDHQLGGGKFAKAGQVLEMSNGEANEKIANGLCKIPENGAGKPATGSRSGDPAGTGGR